MSNNQDDKVYTSKDVLDKLKSIVPKSKSRKRYYLDRRNYLISILYYKFQFTEEMISEHLKIKRCSVNHAKKQPIILTNAGDLTYEINTHSLYDEFPFVMPNQGVPVLRKLDRLIHLDTKILHDIEQFKNEYSIEKTAAAIKILIQLGLNENNKKTKDEN